MKRVTSVRSHVRSGRPVRGHLRRWESVKRGRVYYNPYTGEWLRIWTHGTGMTKGYDVELETRTGNKTLSPKRGVKYREQASLIAKKYMEQK